MTELKKTKYFVREKRELFIEMVKAHIQPYESFESALEDANDLMVDGEFEEGDIEIVKITVEDILPVTLPKKNLDELSR